MKRGSEICSIAASLLVLFSAGAQTSPPASGGTTTPAPANTTVPNPAPTPERPIRANAVYVSGKVVMEDGTPPPERVAIERVCGGSPRVEAYTNQKGGFSFQIGETSRQLSSSDTAADTWNATGSFGGGSRGRTVSGINERDLMGCELRAVLAGYRSSVASLSGHRAMNNPDVGIIVLRRLAGIEGATLSAIAAQAPKDARKAFEKGHDALGRKKFEDALKEYRKAISIYPKYSTAYHEMGRALEMLGKRAEAKNAYLKAIEIDPKLLDPYRFLAGLAAREQSWKQAVEYADRAIALDPLHYPDAYFHRAVAHFYLKDYPAAEGSAREAWKLDTGHRIPKVAQLLGMILIEREDYAGAAEQMKTYASLLPPGSKEAEFTQKQILELDQAAAAHRKP